RNPGLDTGHLNCRRNRRDPEEHHRRACAENAQGTPVRYRPPVSRRAEERATKVEFRPTDHCHADGGTKPNRSGRARSMLLRRSIILALGSMPLLARLGFSQTAVKARRVGLLSSGAPSPTRVRSLLGLRLGFPSAAMLSAALSFSIGGQVEDTPVRRPGFLIALKTNSGLISQTATPAAQAFRKPR